MQTDDVSASQELVLTHISEAQLFIQAFLWRARADDYFHFEGSGGLADKLADVAETNETNGAALDASAVGKHAFVPVTSF